MNKAFLISNIMQHLEQELVHCKLAANTAHLAATDDQSVAETQYDTLAIESAYLAEGQSRRIIEFESAINHLKQLAAQVKNKDNGANKVIKLGSLVQLYKDSALDKWFFLAPAAAGYKCTIAANNFTVITPRSPVGYALLNKTIGDQVEVIIGNNKLVDDIIAVY